MTANEIRKRFLSFFEARGHRVVRSSSLVPANDPTLLFTNAGMNQFKEVFLGREKRDYNRACSVQKCVRAGGKHNDLEQVGRTRRHQTFFEMLGNFSFGDYFKKEAVAFAWELLTSPNYFAIPKDRLYVTIFDGTGAGFTPRDDEARQCWLEQGVSENKIFQSGVKDNFWSMGNTGPCGPCSEIYYDMGSPASEEGHKDCKFGCECGRYVEIWNLVFMQYNVDEKGNWTKLPKPSIDTGAGLERLAAVLQGKISNFDTDLFKPLIDEAAELAKVPYRYSENVDASLRIIADHARAATFLISDGVLPSNEGRGYVLRRIIRRALYQGQQRVIGEPFLFKISGSVVDMMKGAYPELAETAHHVARAIKNEEERYARTLRIGVEKLNNARVKIAPDRVPMPRDTVSFKEYQVLGRNPASTPSEYILGEDLFELYDTFGCPPDFIEDIVRPYGLGLDRDGYESLMAKQRERARASWKAAEKKVAQPVYQQLAEKGKTVFDGYKQTTSAECRIVALVSRGESTNDAKPGNEVEIVLDHTPFYAEAGGQVGDEGHILGSEVSREIGHVRDTYSPVTGLIVHKAVAREGLRIGDRVTAVVDATRRDMIRRNHTATHLLHAALRTTLGTHVKQAGSLVAPDRLRFDFTHYAALSERDLLDIEDLVNRQILANEEVHTEVTELEKAIESGAMALFGEKYGDKVRVVSIADGGFSKELCGGTHVRRTGDIGLLKIISESGVSAGTRRIEAVTGTGVLEHLRKASETLALLSNTLRAKPEELLEAAEKLAEAEKKLRKQLEAAAGKRAASEAGGLLDKAMEVKGVKVISARLEKMERAAMRQVIDGLRGPLGSGVIVLGSVADGNVSLIAAVTKNLTSKLDAAKIVKQAAALIDGTGGGRKDLAEAGGKNGDKLDESLAAVASIVEKML